MQRINVLMCGGRRTGKTSLMAAMRENMLELFPNGVITMNMEHEGDLSTYQREQKEALENFKEPFFYADILPTTKATDYDCTAILKDKRSKIAFRFTDVPGEFFVNPVHEDEIKEKMRESQVLIIAIDSPHLIEKAAKYGQIGKYHEVYNRAQMITDKIKIALQNDKRKRIIIFTPVKCERYKNESIKGMNMEYLLDAVKTGYADLLAFVEENYKSSCAVVVAPCITMGGVEFVQFVPPRNEDGSLQTDQSGELIQDTVIDPETGYLAMTYLSKYSYLLDQNGDRYYKPEDCAQPLLYLLLFLIGCGRMRSSGVGYIIDSIRELIGRLPNQDALDECKESIVKKIKTCRQDGYEIINDPDQMFK